MSTENPLIALLELGHRLRHAASLDELAFIAVNDTRRLASYRQAALWFADQGVRCLSGVVQPETNAPYVQWLNRVCRHFAETKTSIAAVGASDIPADESGEWNEWLPAFALWLPFPHQAGEDVPAGILLAADHPWDESSFGLMNEWSDVWWHAWQARQPIPRWTWSRIRERVTDWLRPTPDMPWWRQRRVRAAGALLAILLFPVRLSVLAHGELVPANPAVIRAPLDGVVGQFHVRPNESVKAGQPLFGFDEAPIAARLEVAAQAQATAEAEYRQFAQQALSDSKSKSQLAILLGKIEEKKAEADYLRGQFERSHMVAPQDGIVLFDDPSEWVGRPVQTGERIMRIASPNDVEIEAWLPLGDAIPLEEGDPVSLYLAASPLSSVSGKIRYVSYDSIPRPDGIYAYRLRAKIEGSTGQRIGLKGTAKIRGGWVPLIYWVIRRPLATIRQTLGV